MLNLGERGRPPQVSSIPKELEREKPLALAIVTDDDTVGLREGLKEKIERSNKFAVSSRRFVIEAKTARKGIQLLNPDVIFITTLLGLAKKPNKINEMKFKELKGFIDWSQNLRLPATIVVQTPPLGEDKIRELFAAGVEAWIDPEVANEALGPALWGLATGNGVIFSRGLVEPSQVIRREDYNFPKSPHP